MSKILWREIIHPVAKKKQQDMASFYHNKKPNKKLFLVYALEKHQITKSIKEWHLNVYSAPSKKIMTNTNNNNYNQLNKIGSTIFTYNANIDIKHWWLTHIFVDNNFRGRKIGSHLLGLTNSLVHGEKIFDWKIACLRSYDSNVGYALSDEGTALINYYISKHPTFSYRVILPKDQMKNDGLSNIQTEFVPQNIIKENSVKYADSLDITDSQDDKGKKPPPELLATFYTAQGILLYEDNKLDKASEMFKAANKKTHHFRTKLLIEYYLKQIENFDESETKRKRKRSIFKQTKTTPQKKKRKVTSHNNLPQQNSRVNMQHHV